MYHLRSNSGSNGPIAKECHRFLVAGPFNLLVKWPVHWHGKPYVEWLPEGYLICTNSWAASATGEAGTGACGSRQESKMETWCTQETVQ